MGDTAVDLAAVAKFRDRLNDRLAEAQFVLDALYTKMQCRPPALGRFEDAVVTTGSYDQVYQWHVQRINRLVTAIEVARTATDDIISAYRNTEDRNQADALDISDALAGVSVALAGGGANG